ncbi:MAG: hypothetical protein RLZZ292_1656 [Bacteroidota bacterium]|jgi:surface polysaccharide O-acyltransferase-like enzyme
MSNANTPKLLFPDYIRVAATLAMLMLHCSGDVLYQFLQPGWRVDHWWVGNVLDGATRWCVPVFVMLSGALLLPNPKNEEIGTFLSKRLGRVVIPYIFWIAVYMCYTYRYSIIGWKPVWMPGVWGEIFFGVIYYHLWFVPMIVGLYLMTPTFRIVVKHGTRADIEYFITFWFCLVTISLHFNQFIIVKYIGWMAYIGFFVMGHYITQYRMEGHKWIYRLGWASVVFTIVATYLLSRWYSEKFDEAWYLYLTPNCIFVSFALFLWFKEQNWQILVEKFPRFHRLILWFSSMSYGVYLGHILILDCLKNGYFGFWATSTHFFWWDLHPIIAIPLVFLTTVILTSVLITALSKIPVLGKWVG